jgi:DNA polymerase III alpha subunit
MSEDSKYVIIELIENDQKKAVSESIKVGLLKGIKPHKQKESKSDVIIVLEDKDGVLNLLNLNMYNILSLQTSDGTTKISNYFRANKEDQSMAFDIVAKIMTDMHEAKRTDKNDSNLIDLTTYSDLPDDFASTKVDDKTSNKSVSPVYNKSTVPARSAIGGNRRVVAPVEPKVEPKFFRRGSKKPTEEALKEMEKRIKDIASGKLKVELPSIEGDDEETVILDNDDDEYAASYMYHG